MSLLFYLNFIQYKTITLNSRACCQTSYTVKLNRGFTVHSFVLYVNCFVTIPVCYFYARPFVSIPGPGVV